MKKLGELLTIQNGYAFNSKQFTSGKGVPLIRIRDIKGGQETEINFDGKFDERYLVNTGDLLIGMDGEFGCYEWKGGKALLNQRVCRLQNFREDLNPRFLLYGINKYLKAIEDVTAYATVKHISSKQIQNIEFPVPPLAEQKRIVAILDEAFTAIDKSRANVEKNIQNAKELFESYLQGVFENPVEDWEVKMLEDVCEISSKLVDPRKTEFQHLAHIGAGNIESKTGQLFNIRTAEEEKLISGKFLFDDSMVLYSKIRPYLMKVVKCSFEGLCSADIYPLKPFPKSLYKDYLYYLLLTNEFTEYAILGSQRAGMPKLNRKHLFAYRFKLPSLYEQQEIVRHLDALRAETQKVAAIYINKMYDLEDLKKSISQMAFVGELELEKKVLV